MIEDLTYESFEPHKGTGFTISSEGYDDVLTLTALHRGIASYREGRGSFSLTFRGGRADVMFNSGTFALGHPAMGELALFLNPTGKNDDGTFNYEISFN